MTASGVDRPSPDDLRNYLRGVIDPELGSDIVELGMVRNVTIDDQGAVVVKSDMTGAPQPSVPTCTTGSAPRSSETSAAGWGRRPASPR